MSALIKLCFLLLIIEISVLANPVIPENGNGLLPHGYKELSVQSKNGHGYLNDEDPPADTTAAPGGGTTGSGTKTTTPAPTSSSLTVKPNVFLSLASLLPVIICKYALK